MQLTIEIPDIARFNDEEMQRLPLMRARDGQWSATTKSLLARFKTSKLKLNEAWADTWERWSCPSCQRQKSAIARIVNGNVLLCQLDRHHDHLSDLAQSIFKQGLPQDLSDTQIQSRVAAKVALFRMIPRFEPTLLCADCNQVEGAMKAALGGVIDPNFSFSPSEIATFIMPEANKPHVPIVEAGRKAWELAAPIFYDRVAFARTMSERIHAGLHDQQRTATQGYWERDDRSIINSLVLESARIQGKRIDLSDAIMRRSRGVDGVNTGRGHDRKRSVVAPTLAEFQQIDRQLASSPPWKSAGHDWRCSICDRSKQQILRKSNKGRWTARIHELRDFEAETDLQNLFHRARHQTSHIVLRTHMPFLVCQDCRQIGTKATEFGATEDCFTSDDLRRLVGSPEPNAMHHLEQDAIRAAVERQSDWIAATGDYWAHRNRAIDLHSSVSFLISRGWPSTEARLHVLNDYMDHKGLDAGRCVSEFDWLIEEGKRLRE
ncbi:rubredoxin [Sphingobium sp. OAS761]|uniref:hypothetical protein n=1 Tax=Sphingobium sp. OAS761 TaxID=2817901 RepID=UPI00209FB722|nr:hypothetical protein [Sphingobium sp. OAS761]MCP1471662.1 rubredoxin [Sphingobium sp. OAS761]